MVLNKAIRESIDQSVLCWLATSSAEGVPNVSPKEAFTYTEDDSLIIANIASPQSVDNIRSNSSVCLSFIDIFSQKGFQLSGQAKIVNEKESHFEQLVGPLLKMTHGKFPFKSITQIMVQKAKPIIAPSYLLFPDRTESEQRELAYSTYKVRPL
ncbi:MAG: pyridoxamine 5'-phosphate oxidase family protein [Cyclobacteriaceae bacterium]|nr:pyridoxamine 5'-phosphate oxidase family protein [Cyclobacteriaceae bacterium HetDA_MAG_MS6]